MTLTIYFTNYMQEIPGETLRLAQQLLPVDIQEKAMRFRRWQDAYACIFGKLLLKTALGEEGFQNDLLSLHYTSYGRPYLPGGPDFNISHSGNRVVCVISRQGRIGIDLEKVEYIDIRDFKSQFSEMEWGSIIGAGDPIPAFYDLWTTKESIIKADGRGLNLDLSELELDGKWHLRKIPFSPEYTCHIATEQIVTGVKLQEISTDAYFLNE
jgi:4'-phosphopantetheinyl transferase